MLVTSNHMVMTTFPFLCPFSTYRCASTICSNGYTLSMTAFIFPVSINSFRKTRFSILSAPPDEVRTLR